MWGSPSGVSLDYGAHLWRVATDQYKTINTTAVPSKTGRENRGARMDGEMSVVTSKDSGAGV